jgi:hypothetical protein
MDGREYAWRMFGRLFRRKRKPADPKALAEKDRRMRDAEQARRRAETDMAKQRQRIGSMPDSFPPEG